jgi:hypothetical protein
LKIIAGNDMIKGSPLNGKRFVETILARTIDNVKSIKPTDSLSFTSPNLLEQVEVEPKLLVSGVPLYTKLLSLNSKAALVNLLEINHKAVREGMMKSFARNLYSNGLLNTDMNGMPYMISENPYKAGLVIYNLLRGGTPGDDKEFWRNKAGEWVIAPPPDGSYTGPVWPTDRDARAKALFQGLTDMLLVLNNASNERDLTQIDPKANVIVMNLSFYSLFQYARFNIMHINNTVAEKTDMGILKMDHMGVPVYLDPNCPVNKIYFVDSSQIGLLYVPGENFKSEQKEIPDKFAYNYVNSFYGNWIIHKAQNCGVITINQGTSNGLPDDCNVCMGMDVYKNYLYNPISETTFGDSTFEKTGYSGSGVYVPN